MDSKELPSIETGSEESRDRPQPSTQASPAQKRAKPQPVPGDLTSRLVNIALWFMFGTTVGLVSQMAVTRRPASVGAGMGVGLTAAIVCAIKDLESLQVSPLLLKNPRKFCNQFEARLDKHSELLADNSAGQERLEVKVEQLSDRVNTLTLAMTRLPPPDPNTQGRLPSASTQPEHPPKETAPSGLSSNGHVNGNGRNSLGTGF